MIGQNVSQNRNRIAVTQFGQCLDQAIKGSLIDRSHIVSHTVAVVVIRDTIAVTVSWIQAHAKVGGQSSERVIRWSKHGQVCVRIVKNVCQIRIVVRTVINRLNGV